MSCGAVLFLCFPRVEQGMIRYGMPCHAMEKPSIVCAVVTWSCFAPTRIAPKHHHRRRPQPAHAPHHPPLTQEPFSLPSTKAAPIPIPTPPLPNQPFTLPSQHPPRNPPPAPRHYATLRALPQLIDTALLHRAILSQPHAHNHTITQPPTHAHAKPHRDPHRDPRRDGTLRGAAARRRRRGWVGGWVSEQGKGREREKKGKRKGHRVCVPHQTSRATGRYVPVS